jgi:hypothetical protein
MRFLLNGRAISIHVMLEPAAMIALKSSRQRGFEYNAAGREPRIRPMAKAKKSEPKTEKKSEATAPKAAAKAPAPAAAKASAAAKAPAAAKKKPAGARPAVPTSVPLIDTSLAAENAAKMLAAGVNLRASATSGSASKPESAMFKQLKSGLNKPSAAAMNNLLDKTHGPSTHKSGQPFGAGSKQVGQNQTFGADVNRTGVPRRTSG